MEYYGFIPVSAPHIGAFHTLADRLIPGEIACPETLEWVQAWTQCSLHMRTKMGGSSVVPDAILASIRLTGPGRKAVLNGRFGFNDTAQNWICRPGQECAALLSWGMAGADRRAQTATLRALMASWKQFYATTPILARGRSASGQKLLNRLGFRPYQSSKNNNYSDQKPAPEPDIQTYICAQYPQRFEADRVRSAGLCSSERAA